MHCHTFSKWWGPGLKPQVSKSRLGIMDPSYVSLLGVQMIVALLSIHIGFTVIQSWIFFNWPRNILQRCLIKIEMSWAACLGAILIYIGWWKLVSSPPTGGPLATCYCPEFHCLLNRDASFWMFWLYILLIFLNYFWKDFCYFDWFLIHCSWT